MFARIQKTPVRTRALFARVQTNACPESCVVRPDFKKHMSGICFCLPGFQNTPVRFCFCQPGFQNTQPGQRSTELCPERPAVPGSALWSSVPPLRAGTFISIDGLRSGVGTFRTVLGASMASPSNRICIRSMVMFSRSKSGTC